MSFNYAVYDHILLLRICPRLHAVTPCASKEKDFQSLNWDKGEAEADAVVAITGAAVVPARRTAELREVVPTAATDHAVRAGCGTSRISSVSCVGSVPISAPLTYISVHIIQAPIVGTLLTDSFVSI